MADDPDRGTLTTEDIADPGPAEPDRGPADQERDDRIDVRESSDRSDDRDETREGSGRLDDRDDGGREPLFPPGEVEDLDLRWRDLQARFVDEPQDAVQRADELVADVMQRLATTFATERESLESQWSAGEDVSTEDLRVALQRYRSFFHRLIDA